MARHHQQRQGAKAHGDLQRGDRLLASVSRGYSDRAVHDLLAAFLRGYPVDHLRALLTSQNEATARSAVWILSELGSAAAPLRDTFLGLLTHSARSVRFHALDAVLTCSTPQDGASLAAAVGLLKDCDDAVRWKAWGFIAQASAGQLIGSVAELSDQQLAGLTRWLIDLDSDPKASERVSQALESSEPIERNFAVAGACRLALRDSGPLTRALQSQHADIASFATEQSRRYALAGWITNP